MSISSEAALKSHALRRARQADLFAVVLAAVRGMRPMVVWCERMPDRPLILGQLNNGQAFAVVVKIPGAPVAPALLAFLVAMTANKGAGFVARSVDDVKVWMRKLGV